MRAFWFVLGVFAFLLGMLGVPLPLLPTVPFLLLATFAFARSSPRLHNWLITHPTYGRHISDWQQRGAISGRAKRMASITVALSLVISLILSVPARAILIQAVALCLVMIFIWSRPTS